MIAVVSVSLLVTGIAVLFWAGKCCFYLAKTIPFSKPDTISERLGKK